MAIKHIRFRRLMLAGFLLLCMAKPFAAQDTITDPFQLRIDALEAKVQRLEQNLDNAQNALQTMRTKVQKQGTEQLGLSSRLSTHDTLIDTFSSEAIALQSRSDTIIATIGQQGQALNGRISTLDQRTGLHWTLTILLVSLLLGLLIFAFVGLKSLLGKRVGAVSAEVEVLGENIQAKLVKVDTDLITSLEKLLDVKSFTPTPIAPIEDHSLALKVADEITRIEQNLAQMDPAVKGHKQLTAAVKRMNENLIAADYQIPRMLGKAYDEGMKVTTAFVPDDSLTKDMRIITRVFKPTVLFKGSMIQAGDIQVSQG